MLKIDLLRVTLALLALLTACSPVSPAPSAPQPLPSPSGDWKMSLTQSGGFAGVHLTVEVSSDGRLHAEDQRSGRAVTQTLSPAALNKLARLYSTVAIKTPGSPHSGCADCFLYDFQATTGGYTTRVQADDTTLDDSGAAELISMLQQLRDNALRSQP